jgi:hypothetical protein
MIHGSAVFNRASGLAEMVIPPRSRLMGETVFAGMTACDGELLLLAVQRGGEDIGADRADTSFLTSQNSGFFSPSGGRSWHCSFRFIGTSSVAVPKFRIIAAVRGRGNRQPLTYCQWSSLAAN